jgi:hypothetical protein
MSYFLINHYTLPFESICQSCVTRQPDVFKFGRCQRSWSPTDENIENVIEWAENAHRLPSKFVRVEDFKIPWIKSLIPPYKYELVNLMLQHQMSPTYRLYLEVWERLIKFCPCHGSLGRLTNQNFCQVCHSHTRVTI